MSGNNLRAQMTTQMPIQIYPDVSFKKLPFYDVRAILMKPMLLLPRTRQAEYQFTLTRSQVTLITPKYMTRSIAKMEPRAMQVQLRFSLLNDVWCDQEDQFPPSVSVQINKHSCKLPEVGPVNVTEYVEFEPPYTNTIKVQWSPEYFRRYCIGIYLVEKLTAAELLQNLIEKGVKPAGYTTALIKEKLTEDADCEIATTMLKVSLNCPLGKAKMSIPCRASTCSHLQCFDASLYLQMNERRPTWKCPLCNKAAVYDDLVIDGYFQAVLASTSLKPDDTEIQLHKDGSWSVHSLHNGNQILKTPRNPVKNVQVISDFIELITPEVVKTSTPSKTISANEQSSPATNSKTVDLTLSDSDNTETPLAKRLSTAKAKLMRQRRHQR